MSVTQDQKWETYSPLNQQIFQERTVVPQGKFQQLSVSSLSARRPGSGLKG